MQRHNYRRGIEEMNEANGLDMNKGIPIACNLSGADLAAREEELARELFSGCQAVEELADGYDFRFRGDEQSSARLLRFITEERKCCPFFTFELAFESQQGPVWLRLKGGEGVKQFTSETFVAGLPSLDTTL